MNNGHFLPKITGPEDIQKLNSRELSELCEEIRARLVDTISLTGGHLASNLGVVELTVALHRVFHSPEDQIVWDVGHQSYVHKLLTGRADRFDTIRQRGGLSGFPKPDESEHDSFETGHSSTAISAACGLAAAKSLRGEAGHVVAVVGDGALTGGLAYEGLNNAGRTHENLIVVLNDNKMSISKNVGAMARHLGVIRIKPWYFHVKDKVEWLICHTPVVGSRLRNLLVASKSAVKNLLYHSTIFEEMGFIYLGPVDGHNIEKLSLLMERAKTLRRPVLIHAMTVKGKGYSFAEKNPRDFHGVPAFDIETGDPSSGSGSESFSSVFGRTLCRAALADKKICAVTAAMAQGTGLSEFASLFHDRFFDVGIAEEHALVFCAGLAKNGMLPVFAVYSTFLQRSYDQILHDAAIQNLHVVLAVDRAGIVGEDGETHQGIFDTAFLSSIPGMTIFSPTTGRELERFLREAMYSCQGPCAVRYARGCEPWIPSDFEPSFDAYDLYGEGKTDVLLVTYGRLFSQAAKAAELLRGQGMDASVLKLNRIKPIDGACYEVAAFYSHIFFFEEGAAQGGIGEHFIRGLVQTGYKGDVSLCGIEERFVPHGNTDLLLRELGLDADGMVHAVVKKTAAAKSGADENR